MGFGIVSVVTFYVVSGLADNLEISNDSILGFFVFEKSDFRHVVDVALNPPDGFRDVFPDNPEFAIRLFCS